MSIGVTEEHDALATSVAGWAERAGLRARARESVEAEVEALPGWWPELAAQGLLGLHVAEEFGGAGAGEVELAVVLEQLGRALAGGPVLPTVLAATLLAEVGDAPVVKELLPGLVDGSRPAAVALTTGELRVDRRGDGSVVVSGTVTPVLGAGVADLLVLGAQDLWFVVDRAATSVTGSAAVDGTRRSATVRLDAVEVAADRLLTGLTESTVHEVAATLFAAEAAGIAGACLDIAVAYAQVRRQFGRPIGSFQAVKHLCADMLVRVEQARAAAWDAARAVHDPEARPLTAAVAAAVAVPAALACAEDCIQVLGGIGFTWEHDAHLYLKRALATQLLVGPPGTWRTRAVGLARSGVRRRPVPDLPADLAELRGQVRAVLTEVAALSEQERQRRLADEGLVAPHWPRPWGRDATAAEQLAIDAEFAAARVGRPRLVIGDWALPTIIAHGTEAQRDRFVRPTMYGELSWCQLFSEPEAGSDLASLRTRAERVDGGWRLSGQKVWTSLAHTADWGICLARTDPAAPRHEGITYFLVDMKTPGIDIRGLRDLTGRTSFNEVFLDGVFVPDDCVVGEVGAGWRYARTTLANERVAMSTGSSFGPGVRGVLTALGDRTDLPPQVGVLLCEGQVQSLLHLRTTLRQLSGTDPGAMSSVRKLVGMLHQQAAAELVLELLGPAVLTGAADAQVLDFLSTRSLTIAGGTSQVLRNVIGERLLGLPRDPA